jgi:hypothetical protein
MNIAAIFWLFALKPFSETIHWLATADKFPCSRVCYDHLIAKDAALYFWPILVAIFILHFSISETLEDAHAMIGQGRSGQGSSP